MKRFKLTYGNITIVVVEVWGGHIKVISIEDKVASIEDPASPKREFYSPKYEGSSSCFDLDKQYEGKVVVEDGKVFLSQKDLKVYMGELVE